MKFQEHMLRQQTHPSRRPATLASEPGALFDFLAARAAGRFGLRSFVFSQLLGNARDGRFYEHLFEIVPTQSNKVSEKRLIEA